ncbi:hypothetical protein WN55_05497 [Dufourea novaeangliae]|uniref:Uncharacterized protein n=1 Tax=Dufourea novaeangliae TaxID=178035 RepID=A0A154PML4_DUFNO|nr:hypothetical protein WN55_05497 [Dufourea novaeangliae]
MRRRAFPVYIPGSNDTVRYTKPSRVRSKSSFCEHSPAKILDASVPFSAFQTFSEFV